MITQKTIVCKHIQKLPTTKKNTLHVLLILRNMILVQGMTNCGNFQEKFSMFLELQA